MSKKDTRPVRCYICGRKMYYSGHPKSEAEFEIIDKEHDKLYYVHARCIKMLKKETKKG